MISRRNFISIIVMMIVILFMFQFSQVIKANGNEYDVNEYVREESLSGEEQWAEQPRTVSGIPGENNDVYLETDVIFLGNEDSEIGDVVSQWCKYTKRTLRVISSLPDSANALEGVEMLLLDTNNINLSEGIDILTEVAKKGVPIVFCNLPGPSEIRANSQLARMLGISGIRQDEVQVEGIQMYSGFLLGGETYYKAQTEEELKQQDLELNIPWYETGIGTKTYMVGIMDLNQVKSQEFPKIIWRNNYEGSMIFAVNGDYMTNLGGMGILDAMVYEMNSYALYPIVNAQNTILVDCPILASENAEKIEEIYSRDSQAVFRDVMWPSIVAMSTKEHLKLTFYFSTKYNYTDEIEPVAAELPYYLQQMKEISAEAGKSLNFGEGITLREKMRTDEDFYNEANVRYQFNTIFAESLSDNLRTILDKGIEYRDARTVVCGENEDEELLSYYTNKITLQKVTSNAEGYTYSKDLEMRGLATSLGYSNILIHMHNIMWPESEDDQWENYFDKVFSNVSTYWSKYDVFDYTTISESDVRIRTFLNLDYASARNNNEISLNIKNVEEDAWFILRLHDEDIVTIENAEYEEIEDGAYLIHTLSEQVKIQVGKSEEVWKYSDVFKD